VAVRVLADLLSLAAVPLELHWHHSISVHYAHAVLAKLCVLYLNISNSEDLNKDGRYYTADCALFEGYKKFYVKQWDLYFRNYRPFLEYFAENWCSHFREAGISSETSIASSALKICNPDSNGYLVWSEVYWKTIGILVPKYFTSLMAASHFGHLSIIQLLPNKGADFEAKEFLPWPDAAVMSRRERVRVTPLSWVAYRGHGGCRTAC